MKADLIYVEQSYEKVGQDRLKLNLGRTITLKGFNLLFVRLCEQGEGRIEAKKKELKANQVY